MTDYIEREALIQKYRSEIEKRREYAINTPNGDDGNILECRGELTGMRMALEFIQRYPAADVVEVVHGRWEVYLYGKELMCSACKTTFWDEDGTGGSNYCPDCGAKMDGGADHA